MRRSIQMKQASSTNIVNKHRTSLLAKQSCNKHLNTLLLLVATESNAKKASNKVNVRTKQRRLSTSVLMMNDIFDSSTTSTAKLFQLFDTYDTDHSRSLSPKQFEVLCLDAFTIYIEHEIPIECEKVRKKTFDNLYEQGHLKEDRSNENNFCFGPEDEFFLLSEQERKIDAETAIDVVCNEDCDAFINETYHCRW